MESIHECFYLKNKCCKKYEYKRQNDWIFSHCSFETWGHVIWLEFQGLLQVRVYTNCRTWVEVLQQEKMESPETGIVFVGTCIKKCKFLFFEAEV